MGLCAPGTKRLFQTKQKKENQKKNLLRKYLETNEKQKKEIFIYACVYTLTQTAPPYAH